MDQRDDGGIQLVVLGRRLSTPENDVNDLLHRMSVYFESMVDADTGRFFLLSYPSDRAATDPKESRSHVHCPLRDLGSAWDATKALRVLRASNGGGRSGGVAGAGVVTTTDDSTGRILHGAILRTTTHYASSLVSFLEDDGGCRHLSPVVLGEPPNIAHNALLLLALVASEDLGLLPDDATMGCSRTSVMEELARGILARQRHDGAFRTGFSRTDNNNNNGDEDISGGIEFFPGEAMTALMELYRHLGVLSRESEHPLRDEILRAMLSGLGFYCSYYEEGRERNTIDANYSVWQIQAFARLVVALREDQPRKPLPLEKNTAAAFAEQKASGYCLELCEDIIRSPAWKLLSRGQSFYPNLATLEIACGLDALSWGVLVLQHAAVGSDEGERLSFVLHKHIDEAVAFLKWSQDRVPADAVVGYGGLGHGGYCVTEQRLDVTGHALSAVANLVLPA